MIVAHAFRKDNAHFQSFLLLDNASPHAANVTKHTLDSLGIDIFFTFRVLFQAFRSIQHTVRDAILKNDGWVNSKSQSVFHICLMIFIIVTSIASDKDRWI